VRPAEALRSRPHPTMPEPGTLIFAEGHTAAPCRSPWFQGTGAHAGAQHRAAAAGGRSLLASPAPLIDEILILPTRVTAEPSPSIAIALGRGQHEQNEPKKAEKRKHVEQASKCLIHLPLSFGGYLRVLRRHSSYNHSPPASSAADQRRR
jgi:hypothetical protein